VAVKPIVKFIRNSRGGDGNVDPQRLFGNLAQTNHYQVDFSSLGVSDSSRFGTFGGQGLLDHIESKFGVNLDFISRNSGLLCSEASLPGTSLATAEVKDNFMGISQEFAHTRLYTDFDFTFYVDNDYNNLRFFEGWIDFISSGSEINETMPSTGRNGDGALPSQSNYYRRMRYPDSYKCQTISITKFEKNFGPRMTYSFMNAFPKLISAVPVSYGGADVLKVSVSFNYDRYVIGNNGFSKGIQGSFADPKQQSSELQQVKRNTLESLTPPAPITTQTNPTNPTNPLVPITPTPQTPEEIAAAAEEARLRSAAANKQAQEEAKLAAQQQRESAEAAAGNPFTSGRNYGIPDGGERFFTGSDGLSYRAKRVGNNVSIYKDGRFELLTFGLAANAGDVLMTSQDNRGSGNIWLWTDLKEASEKGGLTGSNFRDGISATTGS